jgi:glycerol-3-phosphate dehydrogenase
MNFSIHNRNEYLQQLKSEEYDLVIIGGGVTGAGALLDAQSRGMKVCLIEMQDFSQGTSSRSTKLIHGGLRYLKQGDLKLVAEVGKERNTLFKNAPHLTQPTEVIIPFVQGGEMGAFSAKLAMIAYEWLANVEKRFKHKMLRKRDVYNLLPNINTENLKGGVIYFEYKTNDSRLVIENIKKAISIGATAINYIKAIGFEYKNGKIASVKVEDLFSKEVFEIKTKTCISAVGPWTDGIMKMDNANAPNKVILTKGVHITLSKKDFSLENAVYFEVGDGRMVFAIPKFDNVYIGTTDTFYKDDVVNPSIDKEDVQYILNALNTNFKTNLTMSQVIGAWSGLRPLVKEEGKGESEISRKDEVFETDTNLIAIAGGKLTGYRKMAEKVVDIVQSKLEQSFDKCSTENIHFLGFDTKHESDYIQYAVDKGIEEINAERMYHWFGSQAYDVLNYDAVIGLPDFIGKSLRYSLANEMITNPIDFLIHRTQVAYFNVDNSIDYLQAVYDFLESQGLKQDPIEVYLSHLNSLKEFKK